MSLLPKTEPVPTASVGRFNLMTKDVSNRMATIALILAAAAAIAAATAARNRTPERQPQYVPVRTDDDVRRR